MQSRQDVRLCLAFYRFPKTIRQNAKQRSNVSARLWLTHLDDCDTVFSMGPAAWGPPAAGPIGPAPLGYEVAQVSPAVPYIGLGSLGGPPAARYLGARCSKTYSTSYPCLIRQSVDLYIYLVVLYFCTHSSFPDETWPAGGRRAAAFFSWPAD